MSISTPAAGALYNIFVVPMMAGPTGQDTVDVPDQPVRSGDHSGRASRVGCAVPGEPQIRDEGERLLAAAEAVGVYDHAEGTALLTSFVGLSLACQQAGHKPSWFDAEALAR
ncbi:MAG: hypothetical protein ACRDRK_09615 [Pseudonocardia sp.]